jgi:hypothetical protein
MFTVLPIYDLKFPLLLCISFVCDKVCELKKNLFSRIYNSDES